MIFPNSSSPLFRQMARISSSFKTRSRGSFPSIGFSVPITGHSSWPWPGA